MKRFFPTSLALLLVMGSLGHVFAAAFCPRMLGHDCCPTKTASDQHSNQLHEHMQGMAMDTMAGESMEMNGSDVSGMMMDDAAVRPSCVAIDEVKAFSNSEDLVPADKLESPIDACTHCMTHSGIQNGPVSSVSVTVQSKDLGSVLLPVARFLAQPSITLAQVGLPREHAPPSASAPRHILISVFLI